MLQILLSQPLEDYDLSSLRYVSSGGAPLAAEVAEQFVRRVPSVSIRQGYGLTETAALISSNPIGRERPGSVGLPVPGTEVRILDEHGRELPGGEVGEICARSPGRDARATGARPKPRPRRSGTAGCTRVTSATATTTATCSSSTARRT